MKPLLQTDELISNMEKRGIKFDLEGKEDAAHFLQNSNYYMKLASYRANYKKYPEGEKKGQYISLDFAYLKELSKIDMRLRYLILHMTLDIEHSLKVQLLNAVENNPYEDGYQIVKYLLNDDQNGRILRTIRSHKASAYCKDLIGKYFPDFPIWVFVELISFGDLAHLCNVYKQVYGAEIGDRIMLNSVKDLRNACAHSNCLINVLAPGNNRPHFSVVNRVKHVQGIGENARDKKLRNKFVYDFICLLYAYDEIVISQPTKRECRRQLDALIQDRMLRHKDWFTDNNLITSTYEFIEKVVDSITVQW